MQFCSSHRRAINEPVHGPGHLPERLAASGHAAQLRVECPARDVIIDSDCRDMAEGISRPFPRWVAKASDVLA